MSGSVDKEKAKLLPVLAFILLGVLGWIGQQAWATIAESSRRLTVVETNYVNIEKGIAEIRDILLNDKKRGRHPRNVSIVED